uniref:Uncharacterized protein n=1 Tax=Opuntia streptacantha TaxID=393608 RepID=A0A7C9E2W6_OPUST
MVIFSSLTSIPHQAFFIYPQLPPRYMLFHTLGPNTTTNYSLQPFYASTTFRYLIPGFWKSKQTPSTLVPTTRSTKCPPVILILTLHCQQLTFLITNLSSPK